VNRLLGFCFLSLALSTAVAGCVPALLQPVDFSDANKHYRSEDYLGVFNAWTRHAKLVQDVGTVMEVWATFKSWDLRQAYIAKYAKAYDLSEADREALVRSQQEAARTTYEIHLVAQSTTDSWNDLERRSSAWRITLLDGTGAELSPTSIKAEKFPELYEQEFFPTRTPFSRTYTVRFARPEGSDAFVGPLSGRLILRIDSPLGKVEAAWDAQTSVR
jgi:hypothetical protein